MAAFLIPLRRDLRGRLKGLGDGGFGSTSQRPIGPSKPSCTASATA